jgi:RND family efflux transporter MFP subunit
MQNLHLKPGTAIIAFIALIISTGFVITAPTQALSEQTEKVLSVSVVKVSPQVFSPNYQAFGKIESPLRLSLTAQIEGEVTYVNKTFIEGGQLKKGEIIYQVDSSDYQNKLNQRKSELEIAQANLQIELGEQKVAERQYQQIRDEFSKENLILQKSLMLRIPQLQTARANVTIAQSNVNLAEKNLQRCKVISNGDYTVLTKAIYQGSFVNKGDSLGELAQLSRLRVSLAVPSDIATMLKVNQQVDISGKNNSKHHSLISHISPNLHEKSQLQQVYLTIENQEKSFILGEFITAHLGLTQHKNTLKIPLSALDDKVLWLINKENKISSRAVTVIWQGIDYAIIKNDIYPGESIISNKVSGARDGMFADIVAGII